MARTPELLCADFRAFRGLGHNSSHQAHREAVGPHSGPYGTHC